ncbi:MAG: signal peptide peptidase SppA [Nanoarchaeota archaeon]|nr:signal peptide peptidase SppA [Nanoarchaeota archaeon]
MNRLFKVLIFLGFIWLLSYVIAGLFLGNNGISTSGDTIAVIPIEGMITLDGGNNLLSTTTSGKDIVKKINEANEDPKVKGIVLEINSPGGTVLGSKIVADKLKEIEKPTVSVITESGTSGAYWIASQTDLIIADELSIVGSIGVLGSYLEFSGLLNDYNVSYQRLVTGEFKDISSPLKPMTKEEEILIQARLQMIHEYFVEDVAKGRGMETQDIADLADGLFYLGMESVDLGLIDEIGNKEYAINRTKQLAGISDGHISEYTEEKSFFATIKDYTAFSSFHIGQGIGSVLISTESSGFEIRT